MSLLFTYEDFASLFFNLPPPGNTKTPRQRGAHGLCWLGTIATMVSAKNALEAVRETRNFGGRPQAAPIQGGLNRLLFRAQSTRLRKQVLPSRLSCKTADSMSRLTARLVPLETLRQWSIAYEENPNEDTAAVVIQSPQKDILFAADIEAFDDSAFPVIDSTFPVIDSAFLLHKAVGDFSIELDDLGGAGNIHRPLYFEEFTAATLEELRHSLAVFIAETPKPSRMWALCHHMFDGKLSLALVSLIAPGGAILDEPECILAAERLPFAIRASSLLTVCLFWSPADETDVTGKAGKAGRMRLRLRMGGRSSSLHTATTPHNRKA